MQQECPATWGVVVTTRAFNGNHHMNRVFGGVVTNAEGNGFIGATAANSMTAEINGQVHAAVFMLSKDLGVRTGTAASLVFDNEVYASTGNQPTQSSQVDLAAVARAAGYAQVGRIESLEALRACAGDLMSSAGPTFHLIKIEREEGTAFDRVVPTPEQMTRRLRGSLG